MILQTSDILNLAIAFSVVLIAIFIAWALYYFVMMLRDARLMVKEARNKLESVEKAILSMRTKLENSVAGISVAAAGLKQVMSYVAEKRAAKKERCEEEVIEKKEKPRRRGWRK